MKREINIVTSTYFLIGLSALLINDFLLKDMLGNLLTGKMSDFAGLFIFPLFWSAFFPRHKVKIFWLTGFFLFSGSLLTVKQ